jgi:glutathione synthase/RimK-type ligase-like ATP-grasp enzyme
MKKDIFDVLVVYTEKLAVSAASLKAGAKLPFTKGSNCESYNIVYAYFLTICQKYGLKVAFTTSADIIDAGTCQSYWLNKNTKWIKVKRCGYSKLIFDKFSPTTPGIKKSRRLLFSSKEVKPFNNPALFNLFFDKQKTFDKLHQYSIPTVSIEKKTAKSVHKACKTLKTMLEKHPHKEDLSADIIMKDRFGAGGIAVYKFKIDQTRAMEMSLKTHSNKSFILQPFIRFDKGFSFRNFPVPTDIRLIYFGDRIIQTYIRMAKKGDFLCNEHQGGTLKYIHQSQIPLAVILTANKVAELLKSKSSLFALDFIISNTGRTYLLEGNTGPGLDWSLKSKENEIEAKKLIRIIAKELVRMARPSDTTERKSERSVITPPFFNESLTAINEVVLA